VTANITVQANFAIDSFTITVTQGTHGTITPDTTVVGYGGNPTFTIAPDPHYHVANVLVDTVSAGAVTSYPFTNVTANHTITASFALTPTPTVISISPNSGPTAGGTSIIITGRNFVIGATVTIGGAPATGVTWMSATSIEATTPAGTAEAQNVEVTNPDAQSGTLPGGFTYRAPAPTVPVPASSTLSVGLMVAGLMVMIALFTFRKVRRSQR
jgi:hypothetical protein